MMCDDVIAPMANETCACIVLCFKSFPVLLSTPVFTFTILSIPQGNLLLSHAAQLVKNLPAMWKIWVRSLGWEDPLEKGKASYPLQYSGLENSMDCIAYGIAKSRK